jgi:hypothetical protein
MPESDCVAFYQGRDLRTREVVQKADEVFRRPVALRVGADAASNRAGQIAALAIVNMLARVHRTIHIDAPAAPLLARPLVDGPDLAAVLLRTASAIDPCGRFTLEAAPLGVPSIGLGARAPLGCTLYAGADASCGVIDANPVPISGDALLGAALCSCLACAALFRIVMLDQTGPVARKVVSAWNVGEDGDAAPGLTDLPVLDVGEVWMVGAGAVGAAVGYWLREFGVRGRWMVVDADVVKLHNTNRGLLFVPAHAGWGGAQVVRKARLVASAFGGEAVEQWLDTWAATDQTRPDLVLPLANERGARHAVAALGFEVVLHATTSRLGTAQLHRHVAGLDDCIACRMHGTETVAMGCSAAPVLVGQSPVDAALPFISAGAGLLLVAALHQLQRSELLSAATNQRSLDLLSPYRVTQGLERRCHYRCASTIDTRARAALNAGGRWVHSTLHGSGSSS